VKFSRASGEANREYLNPAAFAQVTGAVRSSTNGCAEVGTFGDVSRNAFRTPPYFQFDAQVSRLFPLHERLNLISGWKPSMC